MDTSNWRSTTDGGDWRTKLGPNRRQRIINKIMETLKRHLPFSDQEGLKQFDEIAVGLEERIYADATSQSDYLRNLSLEMLTMETNCQDIISNPLPYNSTGNSSIPLGPRVSHGMQAQVHNQRQIPEMPTALGGEPAADVGDWTAQLQPDSRQATVNKIRETLKRHLPYSGQEQQLKKIAVQFGKNISTAATSQQTSWKMLTMESMSKSTMPNSVPPNSIDNSNKLPAPGASTALMGQANGGDWQEEVYREIKAMREMYLTELNGMCQRIAATLQQPDSLPIRLSSRFIENLSILKAILERIIAFLQISKNSILPGFKEKLVFYEIQIKKYVNIYRSSSCNPSMQQGQFAGPHMQSMQQLQCQIPQVESHENHLSTQLQLTNMQGFMPTMHQNMSSLQHCSLSSLLGVSRSQKNMVNLLQPGFNLYVGQGNMLSPFQYDAAGSVKQYPLSYPQQANINTLSSQGSVNMQQPYFSSVNFQYAAMATFGATANIADVTDMRAQTTVLSAPDAAAINADAAATATLLAMAAITPANEAAAASRCNCPTCRSVR